MELKSLIVAIFAVAKLAAACWPPYLDVELSHNRTLLEEVIKQRETNPAAGWTHIVGEGSPKDVWPSDAEGYVHIPYCYRDARSKGMAQWVQNGWNIWASRIGDPSPANRHRLAAPQESTHNGVAQFCRDANNNWNPAVSPDTLEISVEGTGMMGVATTGYANADYDFRVGRHQFKLGDQSDWTSTAAQRGIHSNRVIGHEWGHVLGLWHEHQRLDRNRYVHFECKNLKGYDAAKIAAEADGYTMDYVCQDPLLGYRYGLPAPDFSLYTTYDPMVDPHHQRPWLKTKSATYNIGSIMHYQCSDWGTLTQDVTKCVMSMWKTPYPEHVHAPKDHEVHATHENAWPVLPNYDPSPFDILAIRELYPWVGR